MIKDFPEGHFAIAMNAINDSEWHTSSIPELEELNKKQCQTFYALLRDHGGFAPTTLGILMNRWGIIEPPNFRIMDHLFFVNLINHIYSPSNQSPKRVNGEDFTNNLLKYLCNIGGLNFSLTELIFQSLPKKIILWVTRGRNNLPNITGHYLYKNYIFQIMLPKHDKANNNCSPDEIKKAIDNGFLLQYLFDDQITFNVIDLNKRPKPTPTNEKQYSAAEEKAIEKFLMKLTNNPQFDSHDNKKLKEKLMKEKSSIVETLNFHNLIPNWTDIIYIPSAGNINDKGIQEGAGGIILYERLNINPEHIEDRSNSPQFIQLFNRVKYLYGVVQQFYSFFVFQDKRKVQQHYAGLAASSAIMARNMSHHIGSHVIPRTTTDLLKKKLIKFFFNRIEPKLVPEWEMLVEMLSNVKNLLDDYICRKAEFIADVTTGPILSTRSAIFFKDVIFPFTQNTALIDTLAANEGFDYSDWDACSLIVRCFRKSKGEKNKNNIPEFFPEFLNPDYESEEKIGNGKLPIVPYAERSLDDRTTVLDHSFKNEKLDVRVALPGSVGEMAFYSILENIIRNAAKHSGSILPGDKDKKLEVHIVISDSEEESEEKIETYQVDIYENLSNPEQKIPFHIKDIKDGKQPKTLADLLQYYVNLEIIDEHGQLRKEAWGIAEMVINACYLQGYPAPNPKSLTINSKSLAELPASRGTVGDQEKRLVYTLHLMKAKTAVLIGFNAVAKNLKKQLKKEGFIFIPNLKYADEFVSNRVNSLASFQFAVISATLLNGNGLDPLNKIKHRFPFRIIVAGIDSGQKFIDGDRYVLTDQTPPKENGNDLLIWLWETWLTKRWGLSQEQETSVPLTYGIDLYLQQEQDVLPTKSWVIKANEFNQRCREKKLSCGLRVWGRESGEQAVCFTKIKKQKSENRPFHRRFILDRHRNFALNPEDPPEEIDNYVILDKSNTDFETLFNTSFSVPFTLPYELLEAGQLRILVLDERIAQKSMESLTDTETSMGTVKKVLIGKEDYEKYSPVFWHMAISANIFVATHLIFKNADDVLLELELAEDAYRTNLANFQENGESSESCPSLKLIVDTSKSSAVIYEVEKIGPVVEKSREILTGFDMVIIHQGILDRINQQVNMEDNFLNRLEKNIPWLVIESGRGTPPKLSKHHKFVPFSIIERAFHRERIAKLGLTRTLMELSRNK